MKKEIHPEYQDTVFRCACGAEIENAIVKAGIQTRDML